MAEQTKNDVVPKPPTPAQQAHQKDADLKHIEKLTKEYETLAADTAAAVPGSEKQLELLKKKGAVTREIDALKRKHDLP